MLKNIDKEIILKTIYVSFISGCTTVFFVIFNLVLSFQKYSLTAVHISTVIEIVYIITWVVSFILLSITTTGKIFGLTFQIKKKWWTEIIVLVSGWTVIVVISLLSILAVEWYIDDIIILNGFRDNIKKVMISYLIFGSVLCFAWRLYPEQETDGVEE